jgi:hypothetical protein
MSPSSPRLIFLAFLIGFFPTACSSTSRDAAGTSYRPLLAARFDPSNHAPRGTLKGDFEWAAESATLQEAASRWERFLNAHEPRDGEYGDGFHKLHVDGAKLELMRVYYLLGRINDGDRILRQIDPLLVNNADRPIQMKGRGSK